MKRQVSDIFSDWHDQGLIAEHRGSDPTITGIAPVEVCGTGDLVFVDKATFTADVLANQPSCVVTTAKLAPDFAAQENMAVLVAPNVGLAQANLRQKYADRDYGDNGWPAIHPSAVIHETVQLGEGTLVGPNAVIDANVVIGKNSAVMAGSVVEHGAHIGDNTIIHPNVTVGYNCELGNDVMIHSGSVIGSEGYGYAQDEKGRSHRIPQLGKVVIEDRVRMGGCNCIDRATYGETRIGAGTKMDNHVHIGHNTTIGQDCILIAGLLVGGSTKVGNRVLTSGGTAIIDHLDVCDDTVLVHRAGVTMDITKPGVYAGTPLRPMAQYMRIQAAAKKTTDMAKRLRQLEIAMEKLAEKKAD